MKGINSIHLSEISIIERLCKLAFIYQQVHFTRRPHPLSLLVNVVLLMVGQVHPMLAVRLGRLGLSNLGMATPLTCLPVT
jgi:hypothetical protein